MLLMADMQRKVVVRRHATIMICVVLLYRCIAAIKRSMDENERPNDRSIKLTAVEAETDAAGYSYAAKWAHCDELAVRVTLARRGNCFSS